MGETLVTGLLIHPSDLGQTKWSLAIWKKQAMGTGG